MNLFQIGIRYQSTNKKDIEEAQKNLQNGNKILIKYILTYTGIETNNKISQPNTNKLTKTICENILISQNNSKLNWKYIENYKKIQKAYDIIISNIQNVKEYMLNDHSGILNYQKLTSNNSINLIKEAKKELKIWLEKKTNLTEQEVLKELNRSIIDDINNSQKLT